MILKRLACVVLLLLCTSLTAQSPTPAGPFSALKFLEGTWDAKADGPAGAASSGTYTFREELNGHVLARHSTSAAGCKGPKTFDCEHGDLLYLYADQPGAPLKAIYFDNEGHVLHYDVAMPTATSVIFLSDAGTPCPRFRLMYELSGATMSGKFQLQMPGQTTWKSYLEWSGTQRTTAELKPACERPLCIVN